MSLLQAIILGIIQGLTEFLPVSSSGHLVITPLLLGWEIPQEQVFPFNVLVQIGTLVAVIVYFWKDLYKIITGFVGGLFQRKPFATAEARMGWYLILATIPAGVIGLFLKDTVEAAFNSPVAAAVFLFVTAGLLLVAEHVGRRDRDLTRFAWLDALWMGTAQILALFPGVSRSGSTIAGGMARHLQRPAAGRFSFLMSIPVMLAAGSLATLDLLELPNLSQFLPVMAAGFITAAVVGYASIHWLLTFLVRNSLIPFAVYCSILATVTLLVVYVV
jgi:undecaprenyl-diphosphatase